MTRLALIQDWVADYGGSENQVEQIAGLFPGIDIFTLFDFRSPGDGRYSGSRITTSWLNRLPAVQRYYQSLLLLSARAVEGYDLSAYDVVFSISSAVSKGVITRAGQTHLAYVNSPARYAWGMEHEYLNGLGGLLGPLKRAVAREILHRFRIWDLRTAPSIDLFLANSTFIRERIWKVYRRRSHVLHPPVDTTAFVPGTSPRDAFYVAASRMVAYKQMPLIAEAFSAMPEHRLIMIGDGPEMDEVKRRAGPNVEIVGHQPFPAMLDLFQRARGFVFAALEDFGIMPVEAQACGTPVIAFGQGGCVDTVRDFDRDDRPTGILFEAQTVASLCAAVQRFEANRDRFDPAYCRENAAGFGNDRFRREVAQLVEAGAAPGFREDWVLDEPDRFCGRA